jgi:hypothetical protein
MPEVKNLDILYASIFGGVMPIPQHMKADGTMVATGENNPMPIMTLGMLPIQFQETLRTISTIQMHNSVNIPANTWNSSGFIDTTGFDKVCLSVNMTSGTGMTVNIDFSHDGSTFFANPAGIFFDGAASYCAFECPLMARYIRVAIKNKDATNAKTTSSFVYLKS